MRRSQFTPKVIFLLVLLLLISSVPAAWAAVTHLLQSTSELTVNAIGDEPDALPGDGLCQTAAGDCTLRAALAEANALPGVDSVAFNIPGPGPHTLLPQSPLPPVTEAVVIDGRTEPDYSAAPVVVLDGSLAGEQASGLTITAGDSTVRGLAIHSFEASGIYLSSGESNQIEANYLGTTGQAAQGNRIGILVEGSTLNVIGGSEPGQGNLISGNEVGVYLYGPGSSENTVAGNLIGTDASGTAVLGNEYGIRITAGDGNLIGGNNPAVRNLITGNDTGIYIQGEGASGNRVWGNYLGLDVTGAVILGNESVGVYILDAPGNLVGGPDAAGNVIAGGELAVYIRGQGAQGNVVRSNLIGTTADQTIPAQRLNGGVLVTDASNSSIGGPQVNQGNHIVSRHFGVRLRGSAVGNTAIENNTLDVIGDVGEAEEGAGESAASSSPNSQAASPWKPDFKLLRRDQLLGKVAFRPLAQGGGVTFTVDSTGDGADANPGNGTCADSGGACTLRAAIEEANETSAADTIAFNISGSGPHTIQPGSELPALEETVIIDGTTEPDFSSTPVIQLDGSSAGASADGLAVDAANTIIRALVINQFDDDGIDLDGGASGVVITGSYIGTNVAGTAALGNGSDGIDMAAGATIGGAASGAGNLISGNGAHGLKMSGDSADGNVIQGNIIGANASGTAALANGIDGIYIQNGDNNSIGGTAAGAGNLISGNGDDGIDLDPGTTDMVIQGNLIGTTAAGTAALANGDEGVSLSDADDNLIGGETAAAGNTIAYHPDQGVHVNSGSTGNTIRANAIYSNTTLGIDLQPTGVTANDSGDGDTGNNNLQNFPVIITATTNSMATTITGTLNSTASLTYTLDFYANQSCDSSGNGEGQFYLGSDTVMTNGSGNASFTSELTSGAANNPILTATATDPNGNTSEFSACLTAAIVADNDPDWQQITTTTSPPVWGEYALAYDDVLDKVVLYGGNATGWPYEDSTWEFAGSDWSVITTTGQPNAVYDMAAAYYSEQEQLFLFGGSDASDIPLGETWVYSGTTWSQLTPTTAPLSRTAAAMVYAPISQTLFLFGGQASTTYFNDLWQFDGSDWSQVSVNGSSPPARSYHALTYDEDEQALWLFGGRTVTGTLLADLWRYDLGAATWTEINDSGPSARMAHALVYQPEWGELVLIGGAAADGDTLLDDTWHYQVGVGWEEASPATSLPVTAYHQAVYDSSNQRILLFTNEETWRYE